MSAKRDRYSWVTRPGPLLIILIALTGLDCGFKISWAYLCMSLFLLITAISIFIMGRGSTQSSLKNFVVALIYLILAKLASLPAEFSYFMVATPFIMWSVYMAITCEEGDTNFFLTGFLSSIAVIIEPSLLLLAMGVVGVSFYIRGLNVKTLITSVASIAIPFIFYISYAYILRHDISEYTERFVSDLTNISFGTIIINSFVELVQYIFFLFILLNSLVYMLANRGRYKIAKSKVLSRFLIMLLFVTGTLLLYSDKFELMIPIVAIPSAIFLNNYLTEHEKSNKHKIQWIILLTLMLVVKISQIID